jgi:hypothetical protein
MKDHFMMEDFMLSKKEKTKKMRPVKIFNASPLFAFTHSNTRVSRKKILIVIQYEERKERS